MMHKWTSFEGCLPILPGWGGIVWGHDGNTYDHPRHRHAALELNLVVSGRGHYEVSGVSHPLSPGALLWIHPGQDHYLGERSADFFMWIVAIEPRLLERACGGLDHELLAPRLEPCRCLGGSDCRWLDTEIRRIAASQSRQFFRAGLGYALLGAWEAFRGPGARSGACALSPKVCRALSLLEDDPSQSESAVADRVGTHAEVLGRMFRRELGIGFLVYRNRLRIRRFLELANRPSATLLSASLDAGFGSYAQFHRVFAAETGESPRAYLSRRAARPPLAMAEHASDP